MTDEKREQRLTERRMLLLGNAAAERGKGESASAVAASGTGSRNPVLLTPSPTLALPNQAFALSPAMPSHQLVEGLLPSSAGAREDPAVASMRQTYQDYASMPPQSSHPEVEQQNSCGAKSSSSARGGSVAHFPSAVHAMLSRAETDGFSHIASWQPHGRAFCIHDKGLFVQLVMPRFFQRQTRFSSFQRQLNTYGFLRLVRQGSPDQGSYYHERFLRGMPELCLTMQRGSSMKATTHGLRNLSNPNTEPDFYSMKPVLAARTSTTEATAAASTVHGCGARLRLLPAPQGLAGAATTETVLKALDATIVKLPSAASKPKVDPPSPTLQDAGHAPVNKSPVCSISPPALTLHRAPDLAILPSIIPHPEPFLPTHSAKKSSSAAKDATKFLDPAVLAGMTTHQHPLIPQMASPTYADGEDLEYHGSSKLGEENPEGHSCCSPLVSIPRRFTWEQARNSTGTEQDQPPQQHILGEQRQLTSSSGDDIFACAISPLPLDRRRHHHQRHPHRDSSSSSTLSNLSGMMAFLADIDLSES